MNYWIASMKEIKLQIKDPTPDEQSALLSCMENYEAMEILRRQAYEIRASADGLKGNEVRNYGNLLYELLDRINEM